MIESEKLPKEIEDKIKKVYVKAAEKVAAIISSYIVKDLKRYIDKNLMR